MSKEIAKPTRKIARQGTSAVAFAAPEPEPDDPLLSFAPVPHVAPRRNSITADRQRAFIAHLAATGIVKQAALHIGASLEALYKLRHKPGGEEFSAAWDAALDRGIARLEDCALARAIEGEERLVVSAGKVVGTERRHNEALTVFFLKNRRGERYAGDWRKIVPGHPVYEAVREELAAGFAAKQVELDAERARRDKRRAAEEEERRRARDLAEMEWEEEQDRLAAEAEANKTPEERRREGLLYVLSLLSLEKLTDLVDWDRVPTGE